jgi:NhaA family Na+:H+ antiporter
MARTEIPPPPGTWKAARRLAERILRPLERFLHVEASSGIVLLGAALVALVWANSPGAASYDALWHSPITFGFGRFTSSQSLHFWINDGLMTVFFFVVGLEIRRELHDGELSDLKRGTLPIAAALGGMIAPALIYLAFNAGSEQLRNGWGVPMATDIAFAVGVLALLGRRVPPALRVLLLALAIIDDIGAILVIAFFYSAGVSFVGLLVAGGGVLVILLFQRLGIRRPIFYLLPGAVVWLGMLEAHVHPTIAGVLIGLLTPTRAWTGKEESPPVATIQAGLHPWVAYGIMPLFALANAGVSFGGLDPGKAGFATLSTGVVLGLVVGKPLGIVLVSLAMVKLRVCALPKGASWLGVLVVGCVAGIGFTMAIFIAGLAFSDGSHLATAKLAILLSSAIAAAVGLRLVVGRLALPAQPAGDPRATTDQPAR